MDNFLSVIIPVYNGENYIADIMRNLRACPAPDVQIIVVDDGSNDGTFDILTSEAANDERVTIIHKENGGVSSARNVGIEKANGEYIWFVDSDDAIKNNSFDFLRELTEKPFDLFVMDAVYTKSGKMFSLAGIENKEEFTLEADGGKYMLRNIITTSACNAVWNKIFATDIIKNNNLLFPEGITNGEDAIFLMNYYDKTESFCYVKESLYIYRIQDVSAANNIKPGIFNCYKAIYKCRRAYCTKYGFDDLSEYVVCDYLAMILSGLTGVRNNKRITDRKAETFDCITKLVGDDFTVNELKKLNTDSLNYMKDGMALKRFFKLYMTGNVEVISSFVNYQSFKKRVRVYLTKFFYGLKNLITAK